MQTKVSDKLLLYLFFHCQVKVIFSKLICGSMTVALPTPAKSDSCPSPHDVMKQREISIMERMPE